MDLLERYLAEVRRNLPASEADDIVAELRDVLLAKAEEQEERSGSVAWIALLQEFGHPLVVAARYRREQWLIGPEIYPFYLKFLKTIVGIVLIVVTALAVVKGALWSEAVGPAITGWLGSLWWSAASAVGSVTIVFVIIERFARGSIEKCVHWRPNDLPDMLDRQPSKYNSIFEVAVGALFLLWWIGAIPTPVPSNGEFRLQAAAVWTTMFWPVTALLVGRLVYNLVVWLRPRWKTVRGFLGIATAVGALAIAAAIYRAGTWIIVVPTAMSPAQAAGLQSSLDLALRFALTITIIVWVLGIAGWLWRRARGASGGPLPA
ncbi:MAG: hypothetical protein ABIQ32_02630 [Sphingomicrobium sp.]